MTIVLDTNVIVAALVAKGLCHEVVQRSIRAHAMASSAPLLDELEATLRDKFTIAPEVQTFLQQLSRQIRIVDVSPLSVPVCRDPDDDLVLATAVAAGAAVIVTGDDDLLVLQTHQGIPILSPRQFLAAMT